MKPRLPPDDRSLATMEPRGGAVPNCEAVPGYMISPARAACGVRYKHALLPMLRAHVDDTPALLEYGGGYLGRLQGCIAE